MMNRFECKSYPETHFGSLFIIDKIKTLYTVLAYYNLLDRRNNLFSLLIQLSNRAKNANVNGCLLLKNYI